MGPLQALALMNDEFVIHMGQRLSETLNKDHGKVPSSITALFRKALLRDPTPEEILLFSDYTSQHTPGKCVSFFIQQQCVHVYRMSIPKAMQRRDFLKYPGGRFWWLGPEQPVG